MSTEPTLDPQSPISIAIARLSDRALARLVGANAYLRGRVYARQGAVQDLVVGPTSAVGKVHGRASDPYESKLEVSTEGTFVSACTCPAWRGQDRHCKHVAALLVALRERLRPPKSGHDSSAPRDAGALGQPGERPERPAPRPATSAAPHANAPSGNAPHRHEHGNKHANKQHRHNKHKEQQGPREVVVLDRSGPRVVSASGATGTVQAVSAGPQSNEGPRSGLAVWLPPNEPRRAPEFEYRLQIRSASIAVSVHQAESRQPVSPNDAYDSLGAHVSLHRPLLRLLARLHPRGARGHVVEARGEEAADIVGLLRGRRVLVEPALMELRYFDEPLVPRLELELVPPQAIRVRVVFERKGESGRRFTLSQGLWLEGNPGWHLDPIQGVARPLDPVVTAPWMERLSRAPTITHPNAEIGRLLGELVPRVALALGAPLPDIQAIVDIVDATPTFILRAEGDLVGVRATLSASYGEIELEVPPAELPPPLAIIPGDSPRPRCIRRDVGKEREAVEKLLDLNLSITEDGRAFSAEGDTAIAFWTEGVGTLPDDWDRFIPDDLVDVTVRDTPVAPRARVSSGVDWLALDVEFSSEGGTVSEDALRRALANGHRLVKLSDGTYAPVAQDQVRDVLTRMAELFANGKRRLPLSQAGRVQDLLNALERNNTVAPATRDFFARLSDLRKIEPVSVPTSLNAQMRPYQEDGFSWLAWVHRIATGGILADDMGLGKTLQAIALLLWVKELGQPIAPANDGKDGEKKKTVKSKKARAAAKDATGSDDALTVETAKPAAKKKSVKSKKVAKGDEGADAGEAESTHEGAEEPKAKGEASASTSASASASTSTSTNATGDVATGALPLEKLGQSGPLALVIAPTSVVPNWVREINKFAPSLKAIAWTGADREKYRHELETADVVVTSYALLRRDEELASLDCGYVILDEAQHIKNPMSATARAARALRGRRRLALTGTPIENRLSEFWSIFDFVSPGLLGTLSQFEERYARPIDRGDEEAARRLRNTVHPFVLRRTKNEVAKDLPEKIVTELLCEMPVEQSSVYRTVLRAVRESVLGEVERVGLAKSQLQILAGLTRLRQAACDPRLLKLPQDLGHEHSGKLIALRELLSEALQSGHRTLVFSQFTSMLALIRNLLEEDGIKYEYIDGDTKDRQERVDRFNGDERIGVFLISLKAGGTGLNLTGADTVVHFDPWWNPAVEDQATDRAHRIGQTRVVTAYRLVARGTIEEKILSLSAKKRELMASVLGREEEGGLRGFTRAEVESLFADD